MQTYQEKSKRTLNTDLSEREQLINYSMGLVGEAGECVDLVKKHLWHRHDLDRAKLAEELGDVLFYIAAIATTCDIPLHLVAEGNVEKLLRRYPEGFDSARSIGRDRQNVGLKSCENCIQREGKYCRLHDNLVEDLFGPCELWKSEED